MENLKCAWNYNLPPNLPQKINSLLNLIENYKQQGIELFPALICINSKLYLIHFVDNCLQSVIFLYYSSQTLSNCNIFTIFADSRAFKQHVKKT